MKKQRLDKLLVEKKLVETRSLASRLIYAGEVMVNGQVVDKPGTPVGIDALLDVKEPPRYVSRGGEKLEGMLVRHPDFSVTDMVAADIGASTGGFTDCLLQHGASKVYAIDVGYGQLAWKLRQDARVVAMERINARFLEKLPEKLDLIVSDVSFISVRLIYQNAVHWLKPEGYIISLIKPQFEAGRTYVGKGGVVRDPAVHREVLENVIGFMAGFNLGLLDLTVSPLKGPAGNLEFLGMWTKNQDSGDEIPADVEISEDTWQSADDAQIRNLIDDALQQAQAL